MICFSATIFAWCIFVWLLVSLAAGLLFGAYMWRLDANEIEHEQLLDDLWADDRLEALDDLAVAA